MENCRSMSHRMLSLGPFCLCFGPLLSAAARPVLSADNIVNAADYRAGAVAPSEVVVLYPSNAGPSEIITWASDLMHMPQRPVGVLGDTRVFFDDVPAPVVYTVSGRICVIVPYQVSARKTTEVVVEYQGQRSPPVKLPVVRAAPAVFTLDASGIGQAALLNDTGCCNSVRNPAMRGRDATLYATGEGLPLPWEDHRGVESLPVRVTVGGVPAGILWAGNVGNFQVNFRVPDNAPLGDAVPLVLTVGDVSTSGSVTMAVRSARQQVLVVDSDPAIRRRLAAILARAGYGVSMARDGTEARAISKDHSVDLVISDLALTAAHNLEMLHAIRSDHRQVKTAVVAGTLSPRVLKAADLLGAQAVLTKPLAAQTVRRRVRTLLQRRSARY